MKKMLTTLRWPCLLQDVLNRRLLFKTVVRQVATCKGNYHPSFLFVSGIGQRKLSMQPKFVAAQKMLLKQKPSKHSTVSSHYFRHLYIWLKRGIVSIIA